MKRIMKQIDIYLLALIVAVVTPGCTTTKAVASESPAGTNQQVSSESGSETTQAQENRTGTVPEKKPTDGGGKSAVTDTLGKVALGVLAAALIFVYVTSFCAPYCF